MKRHRSVPIRVLLAKIGLDGHDRGIKIVARSLRDGGVEVVYMGLHNTPMEIANSAIQEDVHAVGISIHSAAHLTLFKELIGFLRKKKAEDIVVFGGGIIPDEDIPPLISMGVRAIFRPGTSMEEIVSFVRGGFRPYASKQEAKKAVKEISSPARVHDRRRHHAL